MANIKILKMRTRGITGKVKAYFTVAIGPLEVDDMKLIDGTNGMFISFPSKKYTKPGEGEKYIDVVRLTRSDGKYTKASQDLYNDIFKVAMEEYERREGEVSASSSVEDDLPF